MAATRCHAGTSRFSQLPCPRAAAIDGGAPYAGLASLVGRPQPPHPSTARPGPRPTLPRWPQTTSATRRIRQGGAGGHRTAGHRTGWTPDGWTTGPRTTERIGGHRTVDTERCTRTGDGRHGRQAGIPTSATRLYCWMPSRSSAGQTPPGAIRNRTAQQKGHCQGPGHRRDQSAAG
jgi:hypothetical protein